MSKKRIYLASIFISRRYSSRNVIFKSISFLLNQKAPEEKCCGSDLKENITKFTKSIVDAKQIDRNACKTIIAYDDSARIDFQDEHDKNLYNHYSVSAENGFWLSKRGTFGSVCLLADPAVDEGYTYDKIVAQFTAKDSATELAGVPLDKIYEYLDYPGNSININCDNHSNSGSASTASNLLAPKVHDSGTDSEDNSEEKEQREQRERQRVDRNCQQLSPEQQLNRWQQCVCVCV